MSYRKLGNFELKPKNTKNFVTINLKIKCTAQIKSHANSKHGFHRIILFFVNQAYIRALSLWYLHTWCDMILRFFFVPLECVGNEEAENAIESTNTKQQGHKAWFCPYLHSFKTNQNHQGHHHFLITTHHYDYNTTTSHNYQHSKPTCRECLSADRNHSQL